MYPTPLALKITCCETPLVNVCPFEKLPLPGLKTIFLILPSWESVVAVIVTTVPVADPPERVLLNTSPATKSLPTVAGPVYRILFPVATNISLALGVSSTKSL